MAESSEARHLDPWADWLIQARDADMNDEQIQARLRRFHWIRNLVLDGARIREGDRVLDIGAGIGLICLGAAERAGPEGRVVALDISADALARCRSEAETLGETTLSCIAGDGARLPFADGSFDVTLARSVLIFIADKRTAASEMLRVLGPGGRVSIFEPISAAESRLKLAASEESGPTGPVVPGQLRAQHKRVVAALRAQSPHWLPMTDFDERDLVRLFVDTGFDEVRLSYKVRVARQRRSAEQVRRLFDLRGNPTGLTWREAAAEALGSDADAYLEGYAKAQDGRVRTHLRAAAFLTANRAVK